ncbi:hypothetical protein [Nocardioides sp. GY 10127]|uniref:hypothetical protein n=1 Tax=Nocardioides sp. GY 10127 TaxID=2569762 RepID=UPI0010A81990|nr:hypothetical protein [Nocardioides sp. GY 10127]TIC86571.1 hypothetical protein E8D37_01395 [Nocardioides sp. GY 10127]
MSPLLALPVGVLLAALPAVLVLVLVRPSRVPSGAVAGLPARPLGRPAPRRAVPTAVHPGAPSASSSAVSSAASSVGRAWRAESVLEVHDPGSWSYGRFSAAEMLLEAEVLLAAGREPAGRRRPETSALG